MGTNYYHVIELAPKCEHCGRGPDTERDHIGKQSAGWTFGFCGLKHTSWRDWKRALEREGVIYDEYGRRMALDAFIRLVERDPTGFRNHSEEYPATNTWLDADGHSFTKGEFG